MNAFSMTPRQRDAFDFVKGYIAENGTGPSMEEIKQALNLHSRSAVHRLLHCLEERALIERMPKTSRAIRITESGEGELEFLPRGLRAMLTQHCIAHGEKPLDVIADALAIHLDEMPEPKDGDVEVTEQGARALAEVPS